jgi:hypothetical protein
MECKRLDVLLLGLSNKNSLSDKSRKKLYKTGKTFFITKFEKYKLDCNESKAEDDALVETVIYFRNLLEKYPEQEMKDYFRFFYGRLN